MLVHVEVPIGEGFLIRSKAFVVWHLTDLLWGLGSTRSNMIAAVDRKPRMGQAEGYSWGQDRPCIEWTHGAVHPGKVSMTVSE